MSNNNLNKFIPKEEALKSFKQETKFIEGKWYKSKMGNYYKFLKLELNRWWSSEEILGKSYNKINDDRGPQSWIDDLVEIPLSEIQAYLPENHVDKINTMKQELTSLPEKWCIKITNENLEALKKNYGAQASYFHTIIGSYIKFSGYNYDHWSGNKENYTEITFDQFKKWVLKENVEEPMDLLAEAKRRYPIGSKFKCVNGNKNNGYSSYNKETDTWTVTDYRLTTVNGQPAIHSGNGWLYLKGKWAEIISGAKQPEEEKWKVGGWVKCTKSYRGCEAGKYYQIKSIETKSIISVIVSKYISHMLTTTNHYQPECEWVGMNKPNELSMSDAHNWGQIDTRNHLGYLGTKGDEKPVEKEQLYNVTIKKSKVQQVEVVPLQKPCIISTKKSKFKLQIN